MECRVGGHRHAAPGDNPGAAVEERVGIHIDIRLCIAAAHRSDEGIRAAARERIGVVGELAADGEVLAGDERAKYQMDHERSGEVILISTTNSWQAYYYWLDDARAPRFARTVDIHRKPGYDPAELFLDPKLWDPKLKIAWRLLQKKLGFRMLMDVIPLDATLVKGSHGAKPKNISDWPVLITEKDSLPPTSRVQATDVYHILKRCVLDRE